MEKNKLLEIFRMVSFAIGGIFFLYIGINGFIQIAKSGGNPPIYLFIFTVLTTSFGVWSIKHFYSDYKKLD